MILDSNVANIASIRLLFSFHQASQSSVRSNMRQMPLAMFRSDFTSYGVDEAALLPQRFQFLYGLLQWY